MSYAATSLHQKSAQPRRVDAFQWALAAFVMLVTAMVLLAIPARAETEPARMAGLVRPNDMNMGALLFPSREPGYFVEAPRLRTDVEIDVSGPILRARVTQRFENPSEGWVEGTYVFPLPEDAAVDVLKMQIGDRFIEGKIKPREEARKIYEQAKAEGKKAALLEQQRPNIFTNQVANIGPGETIVVQIEYQETVHQSNGLFSFRFPMVVAPRYNPAPIVQTVDFGENRGFAVNDPVPDRNKIGAPVLDPSENAKINPVSLTVNLDAGFALGEVTSSYHDVTVDKTNDESRLIKLKNDSVPADKDFELTWRAAPGASPSAGLFSQTVDGKKYLLAFLTPPADPVDHSADTAREIIFVIDNSGSMSGPSIEQARKSLALAIQRLKPADKFNVIRFDDTMTVLYDKPVSASPQNRENAISYVRSLEAEGGTEMLPALRSALRDQGPVPADTIRQVVFLTDGAIGNEAQLFDEITRSRGDARVFTVGIGSAPNSYFMTRAAEIGRGTFTHIGSEQQVAERMTELFAKLENPVMTDISASFSDTTATEITPDPMPDLYAGEPVVLTAEIADPDATGTLTISGRTGDQPWRVEMPLAGAAEGSGIAKLWARRKIADLEAGRYLSNDPESVDKELETVALDHHLVSRMTSLVAVDVTPSRPGDEPIAETKLPLNLPDGWDFEKVFGEAEPAMAPAPMRNKASAGAARLASADVRMMAAAPSAEAAAQIAASRKQIALPQTSTMADRDILIGVLMILFALMAGATTWFSQRSMREMIISEIRRRGR